MDSSVPRKEIHQPAINVLGSHSDGVQARIYINAFPRPLGDANTSLHRFPFSLFYKHSKPSYPSCTSSLRVFWHSLPLVFQPSRHSRQGPTLCTVGEILFPMVRPPSPTAVFRTLRQPKASTLDLTVSGPGSLKTRVYTIAPMDTRPSLKSRVLSFPVAAHM